MHCSGRLPLIIHKGYACVNVNSAGGTPRLTQAILMEKRFARIPTLPLVFAFRIPSEKSYISTICNVRMMSISERILTYTRHMPAPPPDSLWQVYYCYITR